MKSFSIIIFSVLLLFSFTQNRPNTFNINGEIVHDSLEGKEIILLTQVDELSDTVTIADNKFYFKGQVSEATNAALSIDGTLLKFPLVNDQINFVIEGLTKKKFRVEYENSLIQQNLDAYFNNEVKDYEDEFKRLISLETKSESDSIKMKLQLQKDSVALSFLDRIYNKYSQTKNLEGLPIILSDLKGLFGTRNHPEKIDSIFSLLPAEWQKGFYGKKIRAYLDQAYKIAPGEKVDFRFSDINNDEHQISDYKGKLILLEFWATWCGPCIAQLPTLKEVSQYEKIEVISVSIDNDLEKWKRSVSELEMNWTNIHFIQDENLKDKFFVNAVPYNILLSKEGKILRKDIKITELIELLK